MAKKGSGSSNKKGGDNSKNDKKGNESGDKETTQKVSTSVILPIISLSKPINLSGKGRTEGCDCNQRQTYLVREALKSDGGIAEDSG